MEDFTDLQVIGEGAYGKVYSGIMKKDGIKYAIKKIEIDNDTGIPFTTIREIKLLKKLKNKNIVGLKKVITQENNIFMVMEHVSYDLLHVINTGIYFHDDQIKSIMGQLIDAVHFIHQFGFIHRDIKPGNILINETGILKLADFGLTRQKTDNMTNEVCSLWYRAPELLLGEHKYDYKIDSWSIGCVILQLRIGKAPFRGKNEIDQIKIIMEALGNIHEEYPWSHLIKDNVDQIQEPWWKVLNNNFEKYFERSLLSTIGEFIRTSPLRRISLKNAVNFGFSSCKPVILNCHESKK